MMPDPLNLSQRRPEPELMDLPHEVDAYAKADFREVNARFVDRVIELAGSRDVAEAIDLGCGPGDIAIRLAQVGPGWRIVAVDASEPMLVTARAARDRAVVANIEFVRADAKATGLPSHAFDIVFSNSLLHHVSDPVAMWREMTRLARPGATLFVRDLARPATAAEAQRLVDEHARDETPMLREEFYRSLLAAYTLDEVRQQLAHVGLSSLEVARSSDRHLDVFGIIQSS